MRSLSLAPGFLFAFFACWACADQYPVWNPVPHDDQDMQAPDEYAVHERQELAHKSELR
jgi:hypothetical protein